MDACEIKEGAVVRAKSGGPRMTVRELAEGTSGRTEVIVIYFVPVGDTWEGPRTARFNPRELELAD